MREKYRRYLAPLVCHEPELGKDFIKCLPMEMMTEVSGYLGDKDLAHFSRANKQINLSAARVLYMRNKLHGNSSALTKAANAANHNLRDPACGDGIAMLEAMKDWGLTVIDSDRSQPGGWEALSVACAYGDVTMARYLIDHFGADVKEPRKGIKWLEWPLLHEKYVKVFSSWKPWKPETAMWMPLWYSF